MGMARNCLEYTVRATGDGHTQDNVIQLFEGRHEPAISPDGIQAPQEDRPDRGEGDQNVFASSGVQVGFPAAMGG
jgi:hypothetical protein